MGASVCPACCQAHLRPEGSSQCPSAWKGLLGQRLLKERTASSILPSGNSIGLRGGRWAGVRGEATVPANGLGLHASAMLRNRFLSWLQIADGDALPGKGPPWGGAWGGQGGLRELHRAGQPVREGSTRSTEGGCVISEWKCRAFKLNVRHSLAARHHAGGARRSAVGAEPGRCPRRRPSEVPLRVTLRLLTRWDGAEGRSLLSPDCLRERHRLTGGSPPAWASEWGPGHTHTPFLHRAVWLGGGRRRGRGRRERRHLLCLHGTT